jgi:zinc D-Ala-D-Ala carboxypeptidase
MTRTEVRLPNDPPPVAAENLKALCKNVLEPIRAKFGPVRVNSGFRSDAVNTRVGGATDSQHKKGEAADIEVAGVDHFTLAKWIIANTDFDQVILEFVNDAGTSGWVHVSFVSRRPNRHSIKRAESVLNEEKRRRTRYATLTPEQVPDAKKEAA